MRKYKLNLTAIFVILFMGTAFSQSGEILNINYNLSVPISSYENDVIGVASGSGFSIELRNFVSDQVTIGGILGWNYFNKDWGYVTDEYIVYDNDGNELNTTTISGYKRRSSNIVPIMLSTHYYFFKMRQVKPYTYKVIDPNPRSITPYLGVDLGGYYLTSKETMGNSSPFDDQDFSFGVAPEVGAIILFGQSNSRVNISFKYNYKAETNKNPSSSWFGINVGFSQSF